MKLRSIAKQYIVFLLAFLLVFEPFAVNMVYASSVDKEDGLDQVAPEEPGVEENMDENGLTDGIESLDCMKPGEYLEYMLSLRGRSIEDDVETAREKEKCIAWGEWMNTVSGAYSLMDDGCTDVYTFYDSLGVACNAAVDKTTNLLIEKEKCEAYITCLKYVANKAYLAGSFLLKVTGINKITGSIANWVRSKDCLMKGFLGMGKLYKNVANSKFMTGTGTFIKYMAPPVGFRKGCKSGEGFYSYWRWVKKVTGSGKASKAAESVTQNATKMTWQQFQHANAGKGMSNKAMGQAWKEYKASNAAGEAANTASTAEMSNVQGVAHSVGIGLAIIGIACDGYAIHESWNNGDIAAGNGFSYDMVKTYASLILGVASLVGMFALPVVGQVAGAIALVWTCLTIIGDELGKYNKKWKEAYKNSYWFLYEQDPEFRSYYDNRDSLKFEEKSAAYIITERNYASFKDNARAHEQKFKGKNDYYDDESEEARTARLYIELEKQGVVTSYYNRKNFDLPTFGTDRLLKLWKAKADYMSWKPNEEEATRAENRGILETIGHYANPMTYVGWVGDKIQSRDFDNEKDNHPKVYFNPDFCLIKKYQRWITTYRKMYDESDPNNPNNPPVNNNDLYRAIGLRIAQAPFNYIPLVSIDMAAWSDELLMEAFSCDAYIVAGKEMAYFKNVVEMATKSMEEATEQTTDTMKEMKKSVEFFKKRIKVFSDLKRRFVYSREDEKEGKDFFKDNKKEIKDAFGWDWPSSKPCTPEKIMTEFWNDINTGMAIDPTSVAQQAVECRLILDSIQKNIDTAAIMRQVIKEKRDALNNVGNPSLGGFSQGGDFYRYVKDNTFLNVDGGGFFDWLSDLKSPYDELEYNTNLFEKKVDDYELAAEDSTKGHKDYLWGLITVESDERNPKVVMKEFLDLLSSYQELSQEYESISDKLNQSGLYLSSTDDEVYNIKGLDNLPTLEPLSPTEALNMSQIIPPGDNR